LKSRRFWRWLCVEVYGKRDPGPVKLYSRFPKINRRKMDRGFQRVLKLIEAKRMEAAKAGRAEW
jgi:hypothetical protein